MNNKLEKKLQFIMSEQRARVNMAEDFLHSIREAKINETEAYQNWLSEWAVLKGMQMMYEEL